MRETLHSVGIPLARVVGSGLLRGGVRFVVVRALETWPVGAAVDLMPRSNSQLEQPCRGWVDGMIGTRLCRVVVGNGCDVQFCRWARLHPSP
jgi:hypothetical protein